MLLARKKQGGSQALNDNAKSKANSAGAMLRRYGEQSLQEEIQALMIEWGDEIRSSEKIFLRASTAGKRSFWGYEGAVLEKGDERVVTFPFPTRRPVSRGRIIRPSRIIYAETWIRTRPSRPCRSSSGAITN